MTASLSELEISTAGVQHLVPIKPGGHVHAIYLSLEEQVPALKQSQDYFQFRLEDFSAVVISIGRVMVIKKRAESDNLL